jgi:hypothetical protein
MPEFILDHGSPAGAASFGKLDAFTQGYVEAMFFTECHSDNPELEHATVSDLAPCTLAAIVADCARFQAEQSALLAKAYELAETTLAGRCGPYDAAAAGRDFWYTRNGHGTGFWDSGLGDTGEALSKACRHRNVDLYAGDDGLLYLG